MTRVTWTTIGAMTRQIASLTRNADRTPVSSVTITSSMNGACACSMATAPSARKAPETFRCATTIIMPSNSVIVSKLMAR